MMRAFSDDLPELFDRAYPSMVEIRHDLHTHPELSFAEHRTSALVRERLEALGWELRPCPTETGAVARIVGARPGRRVMIRADIDALPIVEETGLAFSSLNEGVMHACGHDVHTASLLGVAEVIAQRRDQLAGEFVLVFQPAEEVIGGARAMIEAGLLIDNPADVVIGAHITSLAPVGVVGSRAGTLMSAGLTLSVHLSGRGGHGAMASTAGNVVLAVSALAPRLSEVVEGLTFEGTGCACSAGVINAGTKNNVVPRHALLRGTLRTFTPEQRETAVARLENLIADVAARFEVAGELRIDDSVSAVVNDPSVTARVMANAATVPGAIVVTLPPVTPSDDVSEFLTRIPGCYLLIGGGLDDGTSGMHHSPDFSIDDRACWTQAAVLASAAVDLAAT